MKIINFRFDIFISFALLLCLTIIFLRSALSHNKFHPINVVRRTSTVRIPKMEQNTTHIHRFMVKTLNTSVTRLTEDKELNWQSILKLNPLLMGSSYSKGRTGVPYVLGIPTVGRDNKNYLLESVAQLIKDMNNYHRQNCLIVIFIGETNSPLVQQIWQGISEKFGDSLDEGLIDVITPPTNYYPDFDKLFITLEDNPERVRWRTKQTLDYMFLMTYAQSRGTYYLQLEDDIIPTEGYFDYIINLVAMNTNFRLDHYRNWIVISFCNLGFIGKLLHTSEIQPFLSYVQVFFNDQPIDWLLQSYVKLRCCRWDSFETSECSFDFLLYFILADQSQFQHNGKISSLQNKEQKLQDKRFDKDSGRLRMNHLRVPFNLISSHKRTTFLEKMHLKKGETFIWGYLPQDFELMRYMRKHQYDKAQIRIRSGPNNTDQFSELIVDLVNEVPKLSISSSETKHCGFVISYTAAGGIDKSSRNFFYVRENKSEAGETRWFRRFAWKKLFQWDKL